MIINWIDLALSRLKQGFDSPRERHKISYLEGTVWDGSKMGPIFLASRTGRMDRWRVSLQAVAGPVSCGILGEFTWHQVAISMTRNVTP
jgi:hypothetical protein